MYHPFLQIALCCSLLSLPGLSASAQVAVPPGNFYISPNDSTFIWKQPSFQHTWPGLNRNLSAGKKSPFVWRNSVPDAESRRLASEAAAVDPGILYNPIETRQPAGIVMIPQKEVDAEMIHEVPSPREQIPGLKRQKPKKFQQ